VQYQKSRIFKSRLLSLVVKEIRKMNFNEFTYDYRDYYQLIGNMSESVDLEPSAPEHVVPPETETAARNISHYYLSYGLSFALMEIFELCYKKMEESSIELWKIDERLDQKFTELIISENDQPYKQFKKLRCHDDIQQLSGAVLNYRNDLEKSAISIIDKIYPEYEKAVIQLETGEIPDISVDEQILSEKISELDKKYQELNNSWKNRLISLAENWKQNQKLKSVGSHVMKESLKLKEEMDDYYLSKLYYLFQRITDVFRAINDNVKKLTDSNTDRFISGLKQLRELVNSGLSDPVFPAILTAIAGQDGISVIDKADLKIRKIISSISQFDAMENINIPALTVDKNLTLFERALVRYFPDYLNDMIILKREIIENSCQNIQHVHSSEDMISTKLETILKDNGFHPIKMPELKKEMEGIMSGILEKQALIINDLKEVHSFICNEHLRSVSVLMGRVNEMVSACKFEAYNNLA
jgi:hypothetical protein